VNKNFCCSTTTSNAPGILYQTATDVHSLFGYAPNPAAVTTFGTNNLPTTGVTSVTGFNANPKTIANYHYSLDMQYQFPWSVIATLGYQGSEYRHLLVQANYNVIAAASGLALNPIANFIDYYTNTGAGNYNAMIATLRHDFANHFNLEGQYTWAKAMDENSGPYSEDPYPFDPQAAYGRSDYNVGSAFKLFGMWQPVFFHGEHGWIEKVAGDWSVSGIFNWHTGFPWNPVYNINAGGSQLYYNGSGYGQLRPAGIVGGAGTNTDNNAFMQATNPNFGGNGTTYAQEKIEIDAQAQATPFPHYWEQMFGSGRAILSLRESYREDVRAVKQVADFRYVRFHAIFHDELGVYNEDEHGNPVYNFSYVDQVYDGLLKNGVKPFVEISFMPKKLAFNPDALHPFWYKQNVSPPKSMEGWDDLVKALRSILSIATASTKYPHGTSKCGTNRTSISGMAFRGRGRISICMRTRRAM
jgi:hypothetical protein